MTRSINTTMKDSFGIMRTFVPVLLLLGTSCMAEVEDAPPAPESNIGTVKQEIWRNPWSPSEWSDYTVGMSFSPQRRTYAWYSDGWVCRSHTQPNAPYQAHNVCGDAMYQYQAPNGDFKAIRAVGISQSTSRTFAWYADSTVTSGTTDNLTAHNGKFDFKRPSKPGGGLFEMSHLVEADNHPNGQWYYFWKHPIGGRIYRTTGNTTDAQANSVATLVAPLDPAHHDIVGIALHAWLLFPTLPPQNRVLTFYEDGFVNESTTSLDLGQL